MNIVFQIILLAAVTIPGGYLAFLSLFALAEKQRSPRPSQRYRRFAFVVPAFNEEAGIERTVRSLRAVRYPLFDVIVIAHNCTDRTAERAWDAGARVFERMDQGGGKGHALAWAFDRLTADAPAYDAFVVIDADSVVSPNILSSFNDHLGAGEEVIQCVDVAGKQPGAWSPEITRVGLLLNNVVRPLGRQAIGGTAGLRGNGMCFSAAALRRVPWEAFSRTEDLEHTLNLLLRGERVRFAPESIVTATMPADPRNAVSQRQRWELGRLALVRKYSLLLLRYAVRRSSFAAAEALLDLLTPPLVNMYSFCVCMFIANVAYALWGSGSIVLSAWWLLPVLLLQTHLLAGLRAADADWHAYRTLLNIPRYIIWKISVYAGAAGRGAGRRWMRTTREQMTA